MDMKTAIKEALQVQSPSEAEIMIARITEIRADLMNIAYRLNETRRFGSGGICQVDAMLEGIIRALKFNEEHPYGGKR